MLVLVAEATVLEFQVYHKPFNPFGLLSREQVHACVNAAWNDLFEKVGVVTLELGQRNTFHAFYFSHHHL